MARSLLNAVREDVFMDTGAVLCALVQGEQLEVPVRLDGVENPADYQYEAVVIEALNVALQTSAPKTVKPDGRQNTLVVRVPTIRGQWNATTGYSREDVIIDNNVYYRRLYGSNVVSTLSPALDVAGWGVTYKNMVFIQFPSTLSLNWLIQPTVLSNTYGFFELRVTEATGTFRQTWKPVRGLVEMLYSPTEVVPG